MCSMSDARRAMRRRLLAALAKSVVAIDEEADFVEAAGANLAHLGVANATSIRRLMPWAGATVSPMTLS